MEIFPTREQVDTRAREKGANPDWLTPQGRTDIAQELLDEEQGEQAEIPDAYQEYVAARRENDERDKFATATLPVEDMTAVWKLVADAVDQTKDLPAPTKAKWESILRSLAKSIYEAE